MIPQLDDLDVYLVANRLSTRELRAEIQHAELQLFVAEYWQNNDDANFWVWYLAVCREALSWQRSRKPQSKPIAGHVDVEAVKARTDIVDVIGQYVKLRKSGGRYYGRCPIHKDKSPSLTVYADNQSWYCFGCGRGGDAFDFIQAVENLDFKGALARLGNG